MLRLWKSLLIGALLASIASVAPAQSSASSPARIGVTANGLVADFYRPEDARGGLPAVVVIGGSRGGLDQREAWMAKRLAQQGYAALHLAYFLAPGLPTTIHLLSLEYFKTAIDWLRAQPGVDPGRVGIVGTSIGGMAALLAAAHYPALKVVVAAVPSSVVWPTFGSARASMFSLAGQPLPYAPYGLGGRNHIINLYDEGLNALAQHPDAVIPVERINGPVMVICGKLDSLWPSCRMSAQIVARLEDRKFPHAFKLLEYADAGHSVFGPVIAPDSNAFAALGNLGGTPAGNNAARIESWPKAVAFIDAALKPN